MTDHDPLCREDTRLTLGDQTLCDCDLIARVRADERKHTPYSRTAAGVRAHAEAVAAKLVEVICQQERGKDAWRKIAHGYRDELAEALQKVAALDDHLATLKRLDDADTAEINRLKEAVALRAEVATLSAEIDRMVGELSSIRMEHEAEVAALREQVTAMEQHWTCQRCGQKPIWTECGNARCKVKVHPYCACDRDDEVDGHWCDEGCPCEVLADLRASVKAKRDEVKALRDRSEGMDLVLRSQEVDTLGGVLALLDEVQP
jgi:rubrerythrin